MKHTKISLLILWMILGQIFTSSMWATQQEAKKNEAFVSNMTGDVVTQVPPWMVRIHTTTGNLTCSGVLIHPMWILTAAHCFLVPQISGGKTIWVQTSALLYEVYAGPYSPFALHALIDAIHMISPPLENDIAWVSLKTPLIGPNIRPINLSFSETHEKLQAKMKVTAYGWGAWRDPKADYRERSPDGKLRSATIPIAENSKCEEQYGTLKPNEFCAGNPKPDLLKTPCFIDQAEPGNPNLGGCKGDSGGPAVMVKDGQPVLVGLMQSCRIKLPDTRCGSPGTYTMFTKVQPYVKNIRESVPILGNFSFSDAASMWRKDPLHLALSIVTFNDEGNSPKNSNGQPNPDYVEKSAQLKATTAADTTFIEQGVYIPKNDINCLNFWWHAAYDAGVSGPVPGDLSGYKDELQVVMYQRDTSGNGTILPASNPKPLKINASENVAQSYRESFNISQFKGQDVYLKFRVVPNASSAKRTIFGIDDIYFSDVDPDTNTCTVK